ncbi:MAG: SPOR domain-containing protein [Gammaproteobacteria bacterium]|nr:SPOR domain-containing protein [Gammaproteobacteria bacterium]MCG3143712.1 hypothetical protein [Gammaproteobacteria bacterium]
MTGSRRWACGAALLAAGVCGCTALPPALKLGTLALTGASYLVTGRGLSDHLISAIAEQDCALLRVVGDRPVCIAAQPGTSAPLTARGKAQRREARIARAGATPPGPDRNEAIAPWRYYLVLGSFSTEQNAQRWRRSLAHLDTAIARTEPGADHESARYRVVMGPYRDEESLRRRTEIAETLKQDVWRVRLCSGDLSAPPCTAPAMVASR